jgi:hypothetical protein
MSDEANGHDPGAPGDGGEWDHQQDPDQWDDRSWAGDEATTAGTWSRGEWVDHDSWGHADHDEHDDHADDADDDGDWDDEHDGAWTDDDHDHDDDPEEVGAAAAGGWWSRQSTGTRRGIVGGILAVLLVGGGLAFALGRGDKEPTPPRPVATVPTTTTTLPVTTTTEPPVGEIAPLTGLRSTDPAVTTRPALAVKIDNLDTPGESALPQTGLLKADVVFEEIVEADITRLVAIFQSELPGDRVGPVRSARTTDLQILPQLGHPLLAWSGGNAGVVAAVRSSPFLSDEGADAASSSYRRDRSRRAPHNLYVDANSLWSRVSPDLGAPKPIFQFRAEGATTPAGAPADPGPRITWGSGGASAPARWDWDATTKLYKRDQRGRPHLDESGTQLSAQNVVVLMTPYGVSPADTRSPEAQTVGSGVAVVYTNGVRIDGRWERPKVEEPAKLVDAAGAPILLTPGRTWIELLRSEQVGTLGQ